MKLLVCKSQGWERMVVALVFLLILLTGILCYSDYDTPITDEYTERNATVIAYREINRVLFHRETFELETDLPSIENHADKYYGVFLQLPAAAAERGRRPRPD